MPYADIVAAIVALDEKVVDMRGFMIFVCSTELVQVLTLDRLNLLLKYIPTEEEEEMLGQYQDSLEVRRTLNAHRDA